MTYTVLSGTLNSSIPYLLTVLYLDSNKQLQAKFHQSSRSKAWSKTRVFVLLDRVCDLLTTSSELSCRKPGRKPARSISTCRDRSITLSTRPVMSIHVRSHTSLVTSATYSLRTGSRRAFDTLSTRLRHAFDLLSSCLRPVHARHASLRPGFRPGFRPARLMEFGL